MRGVESDSLNERKGVDNVCLIEELTDMFGGCVSVLYSNRILHQPFVYSFGGMCHEDSASEIGLCQYIG